MPINYEPIDATTDVATTRTLLHEVIPLTGSIVSGTYGTFPNDDNIKNYSHGMFQSVYDYPYLSSSANHIFDLTAGFDESSVLSGSFSSVQETKKINMYNQFSQVLLGYTGSTNRVRLFESDLTLNEDSPMKETIFVNLSRLLTKDEIKKGSVSITLGTASWAAPFGGVKTFTDADAAENAGTLNTIGGDYGILSSSTAGVGGVVFYQAGVMVLTSSIWTGTTDFFSQSGTARTIDNQLVSGSISGSADAFRHRLQNLQFNNTTEINSTVYFCRMPHNKFNYSSNPTYLNAGSIRVKNNSRNNPPISYITTVGLYNSQNELLAVAKLSEPLRKDPTNELTLRVRLDY
tara:strand:- start:6 stop:1046 length:1041 start_codon:yes stop_codon:yes gene_type:complete